MPTASQIEGARALMIKFGPWLSKYKGGLTKGALAAFMQHESGGNFNAPGDPQLGEVGFFQIANNVPPLFGYPPGARSDPETNVAIASLEYALEAVKWHLRYPTLVQLGTQDSWMLARLAFAIGRGGSYTLADRANAAHYLQPGHVYDGIARYVAAAGAPPLGSQSSAKVAARVAAVPEQFAIANAIDKGWFGKPETIPNPPAGPYVIPADVAPYFSRGIPGIVLVALGGGAALLAYLWTKR